MHTKVNSLIIRLILLGLILFSTLSVQAQTHELSVLVQELVRSNKTVLNATAPAINEFENLSDEEPSLASVVPLELHGQRELAKAVYSFPKEIELTVSAVQPAQSTQIPLVNPKIVSIFPFGEILEFHLPENEAIQIDGIQQGANWNEAVTGPVKIRAQIQDPEGDNSDLGQQPFYLNLALNYSTENLTTPRTETHSIAIDYGPLQGGLTQEIILKVNIVEPGLAVIPQSYVSEHEFIQNWIAEFAKKRAWTVLELNDQGTELESARRNSEILTQTLARLTQLDNEMIALLNQADVKAKTYFEISKKEAFTELFTHVEEFPLPPGEIYYALSDGLDDAQPLFLVDELQYHVQGNTWSNQVKICPVNVTQCETRSIAVNEINQMGNLRDGSLTYFELLETKTLPEPHLVFRIWSMPKENLTQADIDKAFQVQQGNANLMAIKEYAEPVRAVISKAQSDLGRFNETVFRDPLLFHVILSSLNDVESGTVTWDQFAENWSEARVHIYEKLVWKPQQELLQTYARTIRQPIVDEFTQLPFAYLLVFSDENTIPCCIPNAELHEFETMTSALNNSITYAWIGVKETETINSSVQGYTVKPNWIVLDSELYGNMNEDAQIELSVGRVPFNAEQFTLTEDYFDGLETNQTELKGQPVLVSLVQEEPEIARDRILGELQETYSARGFLIEPLIVEFDLDRLLESFAQTAPYGTIGWVMNPSEDALQTAFNTASFVNIQEHAISNESNPVITQFDCNPLSELGPLSGNLWITDFSCHSSLSEGIQFLKAGAQGYVGCMNACTTESQENPGVFLTARNPFEEKSTITTVGKAYVYWLNNLDSRKQLIETGEVISNGFTGIPVHAVFLGDPSLELKFSYINPTLTLPLASTLLTSCFGYRSVGDQVHDGIDLRATCGTPVMAMAQGIVDRVCNILQDRECAKKNFGNAIVLKHNLNGEIVYTGYNHLSTIQVQPGQIVRQGEIIGLSGDTGAGQVCHLDVKTYTKESQIWGKDTANNPLCFFSTADQAILQATNEAESCGLGYFTIEQECSLEYKDLMVTDLTVQERIYHNRRIVS